MKFLTYSIAILRIPDVLMMKIITIAGEKEVSPTVILTFI